MQATRSVIHFPRQSKPTPNCKRSDAEGLQSRWLLEAQSNVVTKEAASFQEKGSGGHDRLLLVVTE